MSRWVASLLCISLLACGSSAPTALRVRIPTGAGGVGFLPLLVMQKEKLLEKQAAAAGLKDLQVEWIALGGPSAMNDALLAGSVDFIAAGPPAFLTLWDATYDSAKVRGVAAMATLPMYLNVRDPRLTRPEDLRDGDKIAMTAIKVSIPAIALQMYAAKQAGPAQATRYDKFTVGMTHPDGVIALLNGSGGGINAHFTSPPFHQIERRDAHVRTIMKTDDVLGGPATFTMVSATERFAQANPKIILAFIAALNQAQHRISDDKAAAADLLLGKSGKGDGGITRDQMIEVLNDPDIRFTTTPERVMQYADFLHSLGSIKHQPASWKELFFDAVHGLAGS
jgi:NitT/TauT family transport system substrate-binding protein